MSKTAVTQSVARKYAAHHAHGCLKCGRRYSDTCLQHKTNGTCTSCRTGQAPTLWDLHRCPQECCTTSSKPVTDTAVLNSYSLAGPGPWYQCRSCARTHPFDPSAFTPGVQP